jgi:predicted double-glycine peptidase
MTRGGKRRSAPVVFALAISAALWAPSNASCGGPPADTSEKPWTELRDPLRDPQHIFQKTVWSWKDIRDRNVVKQNRDYSCGAASLCTLLRYYWGDMVTEQKVLDSLDAMLKPDERKDRIKEGLSLTDLRRVSVKLGYVASIGTLSFDQLSQSKIPVLVPLTIGKFNHFVIFRGTDGYYTYLADPARGNVRTPINEFLKQWQKNAILVVAKKNEDLKENAPLSLTAAEIYLGTLNRVVIQKQVAAPISSGFPLAHP